MSDSRYPRRAPLMVNVMTSEQLQEVEEFLGEHGGTLQTFSDNTHALYFPIGTQEELKEGNSKRANYMLYFPDGATANWFHRVVVSQPGVPDQLETGFVLPSELEQAKDS